MLDRSEALITAGDLAGLLEVSKARIYELAREGLLPAVRLGRTIRFSRAAVNAFIRDGGTTGTTWPLRRPNETDERRRSDHTGVQDTTDWTRRPAVLRLNILASHRRQQDRLVVDRLSSSQALDLVDPSTSPFISAAALMGRST